MLQNFSDSQTLKMLDFVTKNYTLSLKTTTVYNLKGKQPGKGHDRVPAAVSQAGALCSEPGLLTPGPRGHQPAP